MTRLTRTDATAALDAPSRPVAYARRADVPEPLRWNLSDLYSDDANFESAFTDADRRIDTLAALKSTLANSADALLAALLLRDESFASLDKVILYAGLSYHEDMSIAAMQGRWDRVQSLSTKASEAASWMVPEILAIEPPTLRAWLDAFPKLSVYRHHLHDIERERFHTLSPREEQLLAMAGEVCSAPENIYSRFTNTNLDFPTITDEHGESVTLSAAKYGRFIYSADRRVRREAFEGMHRTYLAKAGTVSAMLSAHVKQHIFHARARGYSSCLEAALSGPNIPVAVYDNLVTTIRAHLPKLHKYVAMRKRLMRLDEIHAYDLYVPMVQSDGDRIDFADAQRTILDALAPLGPDYTGTLRTAFDSRWIDVYETPNKRSGAYCWGSYLSHPYLLLNYNGTLNDQSTIAHELGHAMHSWYTVKHQPMIYGHYATFCAEVASTVNEVLLADYLFKHATTDAFRLVILQQQIDEIRTTVFRQSLFAEYERLIHANAEAGQPLTSDALCQWYAELVRAYYGPELAMDNAAPAEGLRIPHFYRNFYVYTYATSHCASTNIGHRILAGEPGAMDGLLKFLSAGSSKYPIDILKLAGVDMTTPKPIEDTMQLFDELLNQFESLFRKTISA
ncbi:MAG: oligoendopeptidase F [Planctomycetota bacterium]